MYVTIQWTDTHIHVPTVVIVQTLFSVLGKFTSKQLAGVPHVNTYTIVAEDSWLCDPVDQPCCSCAILQYRSDIVKSQSTREIRSATRNTHKSIIPITRYSQVEKWPILKYIVHSDRKGQYMYIIIHKLVILYLKCHTRQVQVARWLHLVYTNQVHTVIHKGGIVLYYKWCTYSCCFRRSIGEGIQSVTAHTRWVQEAIDMSQRQ